MEVCISPRKIGGTLTSIPSKSQAHRLLICAALSKTPTTLFCRETSKDIAATAESLTAMGAEIRRTDEGYTISPIVPDRATGVADCGESGSTLRFLLPVVGALGLSVRFRLFGRLPKRPLSPLWEELEAHGMRLSWESENILFCSGQLSGGTYRLPGDISSQFISGLLFALPLLSADSRLEITGKLESAQYIEMTKKALSNFQIQVHYRENTYQIPGGQTYQYRDKAPLCAEGDWSNAAFFLLAGALGDGITCQGLSPDSLQGDKEICNLLSGFGARVSYGENAVRVEKAPLSALEIDASQIPDLVPALAVCAAAAEGTTRIYGAKRLRIKESDRLKSVREMLSGLGGKIKETEDGLLIEGGVPLRGGRVDSAGDHRISMAAAIASILCKEKVYIKGAEAVEKSYPGFWEQFVSLGGQIEKEEKA